MSKKSRKLIRTGQDAAASDPVVADAAPTVPADGPYAAFADRDWQFHFLPDVEPHVVDEKALHGLMKDWRHGRATRSIAGSVTSARGAGSLENSRVYAARLSVSHHWNATGVPSAASIATSRHHPYGTYVPSASTARQGDAGLGISGLTRQHHWMRRMNVRGDTPSIAAACASDSGLPSAERGIVTTCPG